LSRKKKIILVLNEIFTSVKAITREIISFGKGGMKNGEKIYSSNADHRWNAAWKLTAGGSCPGRAK